MPLRVLAALLCLPGAAIAQVSNEFWPEIDISYRPAEHQRTVLQLKGNTERETTKGEAKIGLFQDYLWLPHGFVRAGYRYIFTTRDASHRESRIDAEGTLNQSLLWSVVFSNRLRSEFRWINKEYSFRIRERLRLERERRGRHKLKLTPYGSLELFYDSRFYTIARIEGRAGSTFGIRGPVSIDLYYAREQNSRTSPHDINALGLGLALAF